jgi:hypothetical protein
MRARDVKGTKSARIVEQHGRILPKRLHVKWELFDEPYLEAAQEIETLAEKGETVYVGEYRLVRTRRVKLLLDAPDTKLIA